MAQNKSKSKFLLAFVVIAALSPFEAIAGAPNPLGVNAANAFLSAHTPTMGSIKSNISNNMPANAASLQSASNAAKNAASNPSAMQNPTTFKYATNMMKAANSTSGQCDVTDARVYCEKAMWINNKTVTKTISGVAPGTLPSLSLCKAKIAPPLPYSNANLINASGSLGKFTGTLTCNYKVPSSQTKSFIKAGLNLNGSSFIGPIVNTVTTTRVLQNYPSYNLARNVCYTMTPGCQYYGLGRRYCSPGSSVLSAKVTSWR